MVLLGVAVVLLCFAMVLLLCCSVVAWGRYGSGGKSCCLVVRGLPVCSHPGHVKGSLSNTPNSQLLLTSWLVPCMPANHCWNVNG